LFVASAEGYSAIVAELLKAGADANIPDLRGTSPLLIASENGRLPVVQVLIANRADLNLQNVVRTSCVMFFTVARAALMGAARQLCADSA
jgi:ankyrin repeat protein